MADFDADVEVNLTGDLAQKARSSEKAIDRMTSRSARNLKKLKSASMGLSNGLDRLGSKYSALAGAAGLGLATRGVVDFAKRLKDIEVQAGLTTDQIKEVKKTVYDVAQASDVRLDPGDILDGFNAIIEKTGDFKLAEENVRNMGLAIRAAGATGKDIGSMVAAFNKLDIAAPQAVAEALEVMNEQGKSGSFTTKDVAVESGPMLASAAAMGWGGLRTVRIVGALAQTTQMATDNAAETGTAIRALFKEIASKAKTLEGHGITVFDQDAMAEGKEKFLELDTIIKSVMAATGGDPTKLAIFGDEARQALKTLGTEYQATARLDTFDGFINTDADGGQLAKDAAAKASTADAALTSLATVMKRTADANLAGPIASLADALNDIEADKLNDLFDVAAKGLAAAAGLWAINKAVRGITGGFRYVQALRGGARGGAGGGANGGAINALGRASASPVFVTNWPGSFGAAGSGKKSRNKSRHKSRNKSLTTRRSRLGGLASGGKLLGRLAGPLSLALSAVSLGSAAMEGDTRGMVSSGGMLAGGLAGGKAGALLGALLGPVGAGVGGVIGAGLGAYAGEEAIAGLYDWFKADNTESRSGTGNEELAAALDNLGRAVNENTRSQETAKGRMGRFAGHADMGGTSLVAP